MANGDAQSSSHPFLPPLYPHHDRTLSSPRGPNSPRPQSWNQQHQHVRTDSWNQHHRDSESQQSRLLSSSSSWQPSPWRTAQASPPHQPRNGSPLSWFQRYYYYSQGMSRQYRPYRHRDELYASSGSLPDFVDDNHHDPMLQDDSTSPPCTNLCQGLCGALCCILSCSKCCRRHHDHDGVRGDTTTESLALRRRSDSFSRYKAGSGFCLVMFLTIFLPTALLRASSRSDSTWILHPGESHRIRPAFLNHRVTVTSSSDNKDNVQVFAAPGECHWQDQLWNVSRSNEFEILPDAFEYDFFYLNEGSVVNAETTVSTGSVDLYLLQGSSWLRQLEKPSFNPTGLGSHLAVRSNDPSQHNQLHEIINSTDAYILLYKSRDESRNATLTVSYELGLATYDVTHQSPACQDVGEHGCTVYVSTLPPWRKQCLLVQTSLAAGEEDISTTASYGVITVRVTQHCHFGLLVVASLLPLIVYSFRPCYYEQGQGRPYEELYHATFHPAVLNGTPCREQEPFAVPSSLRRTVTSGDEEGDENNPYLDPIPYTESFSTQSYQHSVVK